MNYGEALSFLNQLGSFADTTQRTQRMKGFSLEPYRDFLEQIGNPQEGLKYVHVAGSKGKGSTCTYMAEILRGLGYKTGLYVSPFLQSVREQFWLNGQLISEQEFVELLLLVKEKMEACNVKLSYFEFITTMVFYYFQQQKPDYVVLEVGLGGSKDATNVVNSILTVLTQLELEHTDVLGETIDEVAANKLGIMKKNVPMIVMRQKYDLKKQIEEKAAELNVPIIDEKAFARKVELKMLGQQFQHSFTTAITALEQLLPSELRLVEVAQQVGQNLQLSWRFERKKAPSGQWVVLDMAHTLEGMRYLRATLDQVFPGKNITFLLAALGDKKVDQMFAALVKPEDQIIATSSSNPRAVSAAALVQKAGFAQQQVVLIEDNPQLALEEALKRTKHGDVLVLTGSHYLLADLALLVQAW